MADHGAPDMPVAQHSEYRRLDKDRKVPVTGGRFATEVMRKHHAALVGLVPAEYPWPISPSRVVSTVGWCEPGFGDGAPTLWPGR